MTLHSEPQAPQPQPQPCTHANAAVPNPFNAQGPILDALIAALKDDRARITAHGVSCAWREATVRCWPYHAGLAAAATNDVSTLLALRQRGQLKSYAHLLYIAMTLGASTATIAVLLRLMVVPEAEQAAMASLNLELDPCDELFYTRCAQGDPTLGVEQMASTIGLRQPSRDLELILTRSLTMPVGLSADCFGLEAWPPLITNCTAATLAARNGRPDLLRLIYASAPALVDGQLTFALEHACRKSREPGALQAAAMCIRLIVQKHKNEDEGRSEDDVESMGEGEGEQAAVVDDFFSPACQLAVRREVSCTLHALESLYEETAIDAGPDASPAARALSCLYLRAWRGQREADLPASSASVQPAPPAEIHIDALGHLVRAVAKAVCAGDGAATALLLRRLGVDWRERSQPSLGRGPCADVCVALADAAVDCLKLRRHDLLDALRPFLYEEPRGFRLRRSQSATWAALAAKGRAYALKEPRRPGVVETLRLPWLPRRRAVDSGADSSANTVYTHGMPDDAHSPLDVLLMQSSFGRIGSLMRKAASDGELQTLHLVRRELGASGRMARFALVALREAAKAGHLDCVTFLHQAYGLTRADMVGAACAPIAAAALQRHGDVVRYLCTAFGLRPLHLRVREGYILTEAAEGGCPDIVRLLFERGRFSTSALSTDARLAVVARSCRACPLATVKYLMEELDISADDDLNSWMLREAAMAGRADVLRYLKEAVGVTLEDARNLQCAPLLLACRGDHVDAVRTLVEVYGMGAALLERQRLEAEEDAVCNGGGDGANGNDNATDSGRDANGPSGGGSATAEDLVWEPCPDRIHVAVGVACRQLRPRVVKYLVEHFNLTRRDFCPPRNENPVMHLASNGEVDMLRFFCGNGDGVDDMGLGMATTESEIAAMRAQAEDREHAEVVELCQRLSQRVFERDAAMRKAEVLSMMGAVTEGL